MKVIHTSDGRTLYKDDQGHWLPKGQAEAMIAKQNEDLKDQQIKQAQDVAKKLNDIYGEEKTVSKSDLQKALTDAEAAYKKAREAKPYNEYLIRQREDEVNRIKRVLNGKPDALVATNYGKKQEEKKEIKSSPNVKDFGGFKEFYRKYISSHQDNPIDKELHSRIQKELGDWDSNLKKLEYYRLDNVLELSPYDDYDLSAKSGNIMKSKVENILNEVGIGLEKAGKRRKYGETYFWFRLKDK